VKMQHVTDCYVWHTAAMPIYTASKSESQQPNILFIMCDQLRHDWLEAVS
jgi:hypothetical protein